MTPPKSLVVTIDRCLGHRPLLLGYIAWHSEAERRMRRGMRQHRCAVCYRWYWRDEWGDDPGWTTAEREPAEEATP